MASSNQSPTICGANVRGNLTVHGDFVNIINPQSSTSQTSDAEKTPFRCNLPVPTPHYKGRETVLEEIFDHFTGTSTDATICWRRMATIVGIGGMGKSETACKFTHKYREIFPSAAWIVAETRESTLNSFLDLAKKFEIVSEDRQRADLKLVKKVYEHIDAHHSEKVLFIFDNAIKMQSDDKDFGIFDYLPTEDLANQRFPFVIITSQTPDWQKGVKTFKLEELSEDESIDFFSSSFKVQSSECDEAFKKLHSLLQGYPLAMNLATSNIDYDSQNDTVSWLEEHIELYADKFAKEDSRILTEKISQNSTSKYHKTLATVWQIAFQRMQAEPSGANALMLLQALSFYHIPMSISHLRLVFIECPFCPGTPDWMKFECLKESIRLLQRFHIVHGVFGNMDYSGQIQALQSNAQGNLEESSRKFEEEVKNAKTFRCELRVHRLIQLVVRLQMDCCPVLEDILRFLAFWTGIGYARGLNVPAVEEAFHRVTLTTRALAFIGVVALQGNLVAKQIVQNTSPPVDEPAATILLVHGLNKDVQTLNAEVIEVLRRLVQLTTFETSLVDKRCFSQMVLRMFKNQELFPYVRDDGTFATGIFLQSFTGIEDIAVQLLSTCCSFNDVCSRPLLCMNVEKSNTATATLRLGRKILKHLSDVQLPDHGFSEITQLFEKYRTFVDSGESKWHQYIEESSQIYASNAAREKFECAVKSCGTYQDALKQVFSSVLRKIWSVTANKNFTTKERIHKAIEDVDDLVYEFLQYQRDLEILLPFMEAIIEVFANLDKELLEALQSINGGALIWLSSIWVNFSIQEDLLNSDILFRHLARGRALFKIKKITVDSIREAAQSFSGWTDLQLRQTTYQKFMKNYTGSSVEEIKTLLTICREIQRELPVACKQIALPVQETSFTLVKIETRHHGIICDGCNEKDIKGRRFLCTTCIDYDLCQSCYAEKRIHRENAHVFLVLPSQSASLAFDKILQEVRLDFLGSSKFKFLREAISSEVTCGECSEAITGLRFICTKCKDYDLCRKCHIGCNIHSNHLLVSTQSPYVDALTWARAMFLASCLLAAKQSETTHPGILCEGCLEQDIKGRRFKCSSCAHYDLCQSCFVEKRIHIENSHVFFVLPSPNATSSLRKGFADWNGVGNYIRAQCKGCREPVRGLRFMCIKCNEYDLCRGCYIDYNVHNHHLFVATQRRGVNIVRWDRAMLQVVKNLKAEQFAPLTGKLPTFYPKIVGRKTSLQSWPMHKELLTPYTHEESFIPQVAGGSDTKSVEIPRIAGESESLHPGTICNGCYERTIRGHRFRCSTCYYYDLCQSCYAERIHVEKAHLFYVYPSPSAVSDLFQAKQIWKGKVKLGEVTCNECSKGITGLRFMCMECDEYDLCHECLMKRNVHSHHLFLSTQSPAVDILGRVNRMLEAMKRWRAENASS